MAEKKSLSLKVYSMSGEAVGNVSLDASVFAIEPHKQAMHDAIVVYNSNLRQDTAKTKKRDEVSGGGKKPWKQKGTGNARAGSSRSPIWTGGGVTFGPRNTRNYSLRFNAKMRQGALISVLSEIVADKKLVVVKDFDLKEISTKKFVKILEKLPIEDGKILIVLDKINPEVELSVANLPYVKVIKVENMNVVDVLKYDYMLTTSEALSKITENLK